MSLPSRVGTDACTIEVGWDLQPRLATMLVRMEEHFKAAFRRSGIPIPFPDLWIISGFRTEHHNREIGGAPDSRHIRCPAEAADLRVGSVKGLNSLQIWQMLGGWWELNGGRWGGRFKKPDPNHFDLG